MKRRGTDTSRYLDPRSIRPREDQPSLYDVACAVPSVVAKLQDSSIQKAREIDWSKYRITFKEGNPVVVRELCDRCGKNIVPPAWRKYRMVDTETCGPIYVEAGLCKDCINASLYYDKYFREEAQPDTWKELNDQFYKIAEQYEHTWRVVIAAAPHILMTEDEWERRCRFFNGCAMCGGKIETRSMYFPRRLNGEYAPWNIVPLCRECHKMHQRSRTGDTVKRYHVFSNLQWFQKHKEIRVYLLNEMDKYDIYREPLQPFRDRFLENKKFDERFL